MAGWLDATVVGAVLGADLVESLDGSKLEKAAQAAKAFVEDRRPDLMVSDGGDPPALTYTPPESVVYGAALLAHRLYHRTKSPLGILGVTDVGNSGILREDPDIARLLGIGRARRFAFGGRRPTTVEVV